MAWPDFGTIFGTAWGWPDDFQGCGTFFASNVVVGSNPPYSITDFLAIYPNFGGTPAVLQGTITQGSPIVTALASTAGVLPKAPVSPYIPVPDATTGQMQLMAGFFPDGTTVASVDSTSQLTLSQAALATGNLVAIYTSPFVPFNVLSGYISLASASLVQARYFDSWQMAMSLFVAHYCTLYLRSVGTSGALTAGQVEAQGLARGIQTSKSAGGVSVGIQPTTSTDYSKWGHWNETAFGVQLLPMFATIGSGPMFLW